MPVATTTPRRSGSLLRPVELAGLGALEDLERVDGELAGEAHGQLGEALVLDGADAGATGDQPLPRGGDVTADGGRGT